MKWPIPALALILACGGAPALAQTFLPFGDGLHEYIDGDLAGVVVSASGEAEDFIIPDVPNAVLFFEIRGADGGDARAGSNLQCFEAGGDGATAQIAIEFGTGPGQLEPGGLLRFVVGEAGDDANAGTPFGSMGGGGGGGSALLYLPPFGDEWELIAVAGAGGGAYAEAIFSGCVEQAAARNGQVTECGSDGNGIFNNGEGGCNGAGGNGGNFVVGQPGGGAFSAGSCDLDEEDCAYGGRAGYPAGGAGGTESGSGSRDGGFGFGGGGSSTGGLAAFRASGAGGGYSGGGGGAVGAAAGGGGSYINPDFGTFTDIFSGSVGTDGSIEYRATTPLNDSPENAFPLLPGATIRGTAFGSSSELVYGGNTCGSVRGNDVFYTYTAGDCDERLTVVWSTPTTDVMAIVDGVKTCLSPGGTDINLGPGQEILLRVFSESAIFEITSIAVAIDSDGDGTCDALDDCPLGVNVDCNENYVTDCVEDLAARTLVAQNFDAADFGHPFVANGTAQSDEAGAGVLTDGPSETGTFVFETPVAGETARTWEVSFDFMMEARSEGVALVVMPVGNSDNSLLFGANGVDEATAFPILEVKLDALNDETGDISNNFVRVSTNMSGSVSTATPSFNLNDGQQHHASIRYESIASTLGVVTVTLTPNGGQPEVLIDNAPTPSINRLARFAIGASTRPPAANLSNLTTVTNIQLTDFTNGDDRDGDGIPNACDFFGPMAPENGACSAAMEVGLGVTPIDTGTGPAWFTFTPVFDSGCAADQVLNISIDTSDNSACGDITLSLTCESAIVATGDCSTGLTRALSAAISGEPIVFRVSGSVVGDLIIDVVAQNDADNDGVPDGCDLCPGFDDNVDANNDGIPDNCEPCIVDNDDCANATPIAEGTFEGCNSGATGDGPATCGASGSSPDVWYLYTASETGVAIARTAATERDDFDTVLAVFDTCGGAALISNNDTGSDKSEVAWPVIAGESYLIRVAGASGVTGRFELTLSAQGRPANDACQDAMTIQDGAYSGATVGATTEGISSCNAPEYDVWFSYTNDSQCPRSVTFSTCHGFTDFDTVLSLHDECGGSIEASSDDACQGALATTSTLTHLVASQQTVLIRVSGKNGARGVYRLNVSSEVSDVDSDGDGVIDCMDSCPNRKRGDVNGDASVTIDDVASFVSVLLRPDDATADAQCAADLNEDGAVNGLDAQGMVQLTLN
ncbi:MAG TPA: dockerin type I repeat-containing protein [Phycisphaerae bacterium]|nr:dockerin type I repeat-containing protein [Phycisphaerae bacterium]HRW51646.1 dockerin type I repeat-containing protein [Phycisphaerae bacterium]